MKVCHDIRWIPEFGRERELDWLKNMGDWMISKKRFWGLALPIWVCDTCGAFEIFGGRQELEGRATAGWREFEGHSPHRPWIDLVKIRCAKCGGEASRIPDVGNPWLDAGIVPYSTMGYNRDRQLWEKWFPADFITECFPGQFRNWFYAMLAMSTMMEGRAPFRVLLGHALVRDEHGEEMHKSKGNAIPFEDAAEKMGADLMRWMLCRQNPATNINFGYGPADELRNKFVLKLWNTYAFFSNYARLDEFDPNAAQVPVSERPDIDRWILSDLQLLIRAARREFERFNVMGFCHAAEEFVEDRLSNWYVRRNRRRFWKSERGRDKQAAYQTLFAVLETLTRLFAPVMPFLTETMYQNLAGSCSRHEASVHHCRFPLVDESLIDAELSADMEALLRLISLGSAARNSVKIKVRQPLAELRVQPSSDRERRAVERLADQICEELNVKRVTLHDHAAAPLLGHELHANMKQLGPKLGPRLHEVQAVLGELSAEVMVRLAEGVQAGAAIELECPGGAVTLEPGDVVVVSSAPEGWAGISDHGTQLILDVRVTEDLAREGMAREVVRHVQELRKQARLEMEDRIALWLTTESDALRAAIDAHKNYVCTETLAVDWASGSLGGDARRASVKVGGQRIEIEIRRVATQQG
jgi:isoleucyl-tRNA synthetase